MNKNFIKEIKSTKRIISLIILIVLVFLSFGISKSRFLTNGKESSYKIYPISIPKKVSFAGEEMSLDEDDLIERMDKIMVENLNVETVLKISDHEKLI